MAMWTNCRKCRWRDGDYGEAEESKDGQRHPPTGDGIDERRFREDEKEVAEEDDREACGEGVGGRCCKSEFIYPKHSQGKNSNGE
jgi:hypothetical protein